MTEILIIEADYILSRVYATALMADGRSAIRTCNDGQRAINLIDEKIPDVIVMELQLIEHGGIELLYELRSYPEWRCIPIIVHSLVSPNLFINNNQQMKSLGVVKYLYKPSTSLRKLQTTVSDIIQAVPV